MTNELMENEEKINQHGKRADAIVERHAATLSGQHPGQKELRQI
jgi:hypothetical protein